MTLPHPPSSLQPALSVVILCARPEIILHEDIAIGGSCEHSGALLNCPITAFVPALAMHDGQRRPPAE
jgi:hypothetical protein